MKRIGITVIGLIFLGLIFGGCETPTSESKEQYYYYEFFRISKTNFNNISQPLTINFNTVKNYRNQLRAYSVDFLGSGTDATRNDIYSILTQHGMTPTDANNGISLLDSNGNCIIYFEYLPDIANYLIISYVEKI